MNISKEDFEKLYNLYEKKSGIFAKFKFKKMINSKQGQDCINLIKNTLNNSFYGKDKYSLRDSCYIFVRLLNKFSISDINEMISNHVSNNSFSNEKETDDFKREMFSLVGLNYPNETESLNITFPAELLKNDITDVNLIINIYGESIFKAITENDLYNYKVFTRFDPKSEEVNNYSDFMNYRSKGASIENQTLFNHTLCMLIEKYTLNELLNNKEIIKKEIETGLTFFLSKLNEDKNIYSNKRETFDKLINHFDSRTFVILHNIKSYLQPMLDIIMSNRLENEDINKIKDIYEVFKIISNYVKTSNYDGLLQFIEDFENKDEQKRPFYEILNDNILDYEFLFRKEIVDNTRSFDSLKPEIIEFSSLSGKKIEIECSLVNKVDQLTSSLVHVFESKPMGKDAASEFVFDTIGTVANYALSYKTRSKEELKQIIVKLYELGIEFNNTYKYGPNVLDIAKEKVKEILEPNEFDIAEKHFKIYMDNYMDYAQVNQVSKRDDLLYNFLEEQTEAFSKPLIDGIDNYKEMNRNLSFFYKPKGEKLLATQILRLNSFDDFRSLIFLNESYPYSMAVSFDSKSMSEDSIMISSTGNIETNNREIQAFYNSYPLNNRSASLGMLENTIGESKMTRRRNSEIDLVRASVSPKTLLFFFKSPIDDNVIEGVKEAEKIAKKANLKLVVVDYSSILYELKLKDEQKEKNLEKKEQFKDEIIHSIGK